MDDRDEERREVRWLDSAGLQSRFVSALIAGKVWRRRRRGGRPGRWRIVRWVAKVGEARRGEAVTGPIAVDGLGCEDMKGVCGVVGTFHL